MAMANMNLICVFVTKLWPVQALACGGDGDGGTTKNIISLKLFDISYYSVKVIYAELLFEIKWPPTKAIIPQKAAPLSSLSHYKSK